MAEESSGWSRSRVRAAAHPATSVGRADQCVSLMLHRLSNDRVIGAYDRLPGRHVVEQFERAHPLRIVTHAAVQGHDGLIRSDQHIQRPQISGHFARRHMTVKDDVRLVLQAGLSIAQRLPASRQRRESPPNRIDGQSRPRFPCPSPDRGARYSPPSCVRPAARSAAADHRRAAPDRRRSAP